MAQEQVNYTVYTCDRCITKTKDPVGWAGVNCQTKQGGVCVIPNYRGDLCTMCVTEFENWWNAGKKED